MTTRRDFLAAAALGVGAAPLQFADVTPILNTPTRHKQVFGIRHVSDGEGLGQMRNALNAYEIAHGEGPGTLHAVGVLYGTSIAFALSDDIWKDYRLSDLLKLRNDPIALEGTNANPYATGTDTSVAALVKRGASFFVCNNALEGLAKALAGYGLVHESLPRVVERMRGALLPGATLVPAGVAALNDAQEQHYTYVAV